jgi:hypothetical protein
MNGTLAELADVIGMPGAKALCSMWGGQRLYIRRTPSADSALVALLGELLVGRLAARYGGDRIELPVPDVAAARRAEVLRLLRSEHLLLREIATRVGLSERRVRQIIFAAGLDQRE